MPPLQHLAFEQQYSQCNNPYLTRQTPLERTGNEATKMYKPTPFKYEDPYQMYTMAAIPYMYIPDGIQNNLAVPLMTTNAPLPLPKHTSRRAFSLRAQSTHTHSQQSMAVTGDETDTGAASDLSTSHQRKPGTSSSHCAGEGTSKQPTEEAVRKRQVRLMKNREAARECRRKKKEYVRCLENRVAVLENQNRSLMDELRVIKQMYRE
ncbi:hypothetical protein WMY93_029577 [Mugilogobius chulae]|uniref:BZIP domain-containing protein n=1 Tax=Mugilogobius chulae TaxID=88201 RepID=A0AAW0MS67_9GOBI